jgi:hypothetical protein
VADPPSCLLYSVAVAAPVKKTNMETQMSHSSLVLISKAQLEEGRGK